MKKSIIINIILFIIVILLFKELYYQFCDNVEFEFFKQMILNDNETNNDRYWEIFRSQDKVYSNLDLSEIDFSTHNVIISAGSRIKKIKYKRNINFPFNKTKVIIPYVENEFDSNKLYIYLTNKIEIYEDMRVYPQDMIIK